MNAGDAVLRVEGAHVHGLAIVEPVDVERGLRAVDDELRPGRARRRVDGLVGAYQHVLVAGLLGEVELLADGRCPRRGVTIAVMVVATDSPARRPAHLRRSRRRRSWCPGVLPAGASTSAAAPPMGAPSGSLTNSWSRFSTPGTRTVASGTSTTSQRALRHGHRASTSSPVGRRCR